LADVRKFLEAHKDAKTLIIDARMHRGGGLAEMDLMFPQLFARPTTLVAMDTRLAVDGRDGNPMQDASVRKVAGPEGVSRSEHFVVPAAQQGALGKAKVYLLISGRTASAGEHLALSLKRTKRATLVGETTRGAGHYGGMVPLDETFTYAAFIPVGRTFDPDTGEGWEGTGVKPDIAVPADQALDKALELAGVKVDSKVALAGLE
jgi:C-terminal processing protease CtpA/Prc